MDENEKNEQEHNNFDKNRNPIIITKNIPGSKSIIHHDLLKEINLHETF